LRGSALMNTLLILPACTIGGEAAINFGCLYNLKFHVPSVNG